MRVLSVVEKSEHANLRNPDSYRVPGSPERSQERVFLPSQLRLYVAHLMAKFGKQTPLRTQQGGNERVHRRKDGNWGLQEEARRLKQGAHRYRRREALTRRDRRREREVLVELLKKEQPSD